MIVSRNESCDRNRVKMVGLFWAQEEDRFLGLLLPKRKLRNSA